MNELSISEKWPSLVVERGQLAKQQEIYHRSNKVYRVWRTTGDIDGLDAGNFAHAFGLRRVGGGCGKSAVRSAGAYTDGRHRLGGDLFYCLQHSFAGHCSEIAVIAGRNRPVHDQDEFPGIFGNASHAAIFPPPLPKGP